MSINLPDTIQQNLGYPLLHKIDTSTGEVNEQDIEPHADVFGQAAIPAILTALYRFVQTDAGAAMFLQDQHHADWLKILFDENRKEAIQTIAAYASQSKENPIEKMNAIAREAVRVAKENLPAQPDLKDVKLFFNAQKAHILIYLLPGLRMGELLDDNTLDDDTHKMEGPLSGLLNKIGNAFSTPITEEEIEKKIV